jgi:hypothetical protein
MHLRYMYLGCRITILIQLAISIDVIRLKCCWSYFEGSMLHYYTVRVIVMKSFENQCIYDYYTKPCHSSGIYSLQITDVICLKCCWSYFEGSMLHYYTDRVIVVKSLEKQSFLPLLHAPCLVVYIL